MHPLKPATDRAHDVLHAERSSLDAIFQPRSIAVVGATEAPNSVGRTLLWNLIGNPFGGTVYPVNPKRSSVLGIRAYPTVADLPEKVDLAVVVTPAPAVPGVIGQCADAGVKAAIVISAGFKEMGPDGAALERQVLAEARRGRMRLIGPNCLGVMNPLTGLNATFAAGMARPGNVAFLSQSGALLTAILDWSQKELVGFSGFVSTGSMLDVGWGDLIDYFGSDPRTQSILIYMESIGDARAFLSAAREVALSKPIIVIKAGRTEQAAKAAASHTGSLTGSDEVLNAAFRRSGVLRVQNIADLFYMAEVLAKQPRPRGPRLTIVTNAGGPGVLATDALIEAGGQLAPLADTTITAFNELLPPHWSHNNPVDILGDAGPDRYAKALEIAAADPNSDGMLVILTPQDMTDATLTAEALKKHAKIEGKPVLASWMGGPTTQAGVAILNTAGIPTFDFPDTAARAFHYMWRYTYHLRGLYETPMLDDETDHLDRATADAVISGASAAGITLLDEFDSKRLLSAYGIPTVRTAVARTHDEALTAAASIGYPVVLKLYSKTITHKSDVDGVRLNLQNADAVLSAFDGIEAAVRQKSGPGHFQGVTVQSMVKTIDGYELIVGSSIDPQFGPVLLFGTGGTLVEVFKDRALGLPPLNATLARRMMEQTRILTALKGVRGRKPIDLLALEQLLVRFGQLVIEQPWIKEIDINPLVASPDGLVALDARVVLHHNSTPPDRLPRPAIRPYPRQYASPWTMKDGTPVVIRPIRPEDEPLLVRFHQTLSDRSVQLRYFHAMKLSARTAHDRLTRVCFNDYDREIALVAERSDVETGLREILGVARLSKVPHSSEGEFALLISDQWQNRGLGRELLSRILRIARDEKLGRVTADIMRENTEMQRVCEKVGFTLTADLEEGVVRAAIQL
ncbi:bifunctional acetate--CoA ligase family protein/GNAT family N-acetyltransferase [Humisphaera borealis]|uniref:Bifunctional acetate--CoA ligase family protein/GNAT family N-acetyltransferase n=1 Tax=Humisphaera borealis TaxID=2807512 RepID=A0A7M2X143_9BACT|nr:bifunctional acetate--CoA ligase family protein/GNAT family N-acetyltransferase [Humisphaera borealis]QOV91458.1 bifunctional acetate--CoA ligase family protein/GNAT family N-acetyltransferase [Humisphaera borealis]